MIFIKQILISNSVFFEQIAILQDGKLQDFLYEEKDNENYLGNIYKGRVVNILPGMDAAFIDVGLKKNAYIHKNELLSDKFLREKKITKKEATSINKVIKVGEEILVQISREPIGEKDISVTTDISLPGKFIALIPRSLEINISNKIKNQEERKRLQEIGKSIMTEGNGMIFRTFSQNRNKDVIEKEYMMLSDLYNQIQKEYNYSYAPKLLYKNNPIIERLFKDYVDFSVDEIYVDDKEVKVQIIELIKKYNASGELKGIKVIDTCDNVFKMFNIEKQINMLFDRKVELENGGSIFIDVTEALTVIDVNSGKYIGNANLEETALTLNLCALDEIARQIKLRNISGIIIIDFIDVKDENNVNLIIENARRVFKSDKAKTKVIGMTKLNLMEITRKKNKENFFNLMTEDCEHCRGGGKVNSKIQIILKIENIVRKIKTNTSCESVVLNIGSIMYNKILNTCMDNITKIEQKYNIKIQIEENKNILTEDIVIEKMGKIEYINLQK
nr:Rne/Rng family ribonuclease [Sedimentibacter sp.]